MKLDCTESHLPSVQGKMDTVSARVPRHTSTSLRLLVELGMFPTLSDAVRETLATGLESIKPVCPDLAKFVKKVRAFDDEYWKVRTDRDKVLSLVKDIDDLKEVLGKVGLAWTLFDIEREGSAMLVAIRKELLE